MLILKWLQLGIFLGCEHTMRNYETALFEAQLSDDKSVEQWELEGAKDSARRANERFNTLLESWEPPAIDVSQKEALTEFVAKRKREIPEAWY